MSLSRRKFVAASLASAAGVLAARGPALAQPVPQKLPKREVPWLKEIQTPPRQSFEDAPPPPALLPLLVDAGKNPIRTQAHWEKHRVYLL